MVTQVWVPWKCVVAEESRSGHSQCRRSWSAVVLSARLLMVWLTVPLVARHHAQWTAKVTGQILPSAVAPVAVDSNSECSLLPKKQSMAGSSVPISLGTSSSKLAMKMCHVQLTAKATGPSGINAQTVVAQMALNLGIGSSQWRLSMGACSAAIWTGLRSAPATQSQYLAQLMQSVSGQHMGNAVPHASTRSRRLPSPRLASG